MYSEEQKRNLRNEDDEEVLSSSTFQTNSSRPIKKVGDTPEKGKKKKEKKGKKKEKALEENKG